MVRTVLFLEWFTKTPCIKLSTDHYDVAAARPFERGAGPSHAGGIKEWRDTKRTPDQLRYVDESHTQRSSSDKSRWRQILPITRGLRERK